MIIDATCTPADITYPTDMKLLNHTRETLERIIDRLHKPLKGEVKKPRTYREKARKDFINFTKKKKPGAVVTHQSIGVQLNYIQRDLGHVETLLTQGANLTYLNKYDYKCLLVSHTIYEQQLEMYINETKRVDDRIVNLMQPHIRPIIRGKAGKNVEFGAKISVSCVDGYVHMDHLNWNAFNESGDLEKQAEAYKKRHGCYPESVHADQIYKTRANRSYCKGKGIRLSGPPLGRPRKETAENKEELETIKQQRYDDEIERIQIEGKFGNAKRKGTLARIMAKLVETSEAVIGIGLIMLNLDKALRAVLCWLCFWLNKALAGSYEAIFKPGEPGTGVKHHRISQGKSFIELAA